MKQFKPRGWDNPSLKVASCRNGYSNFETPLFDKLHEFSLSSQLPAAVMLFMDSIVELRDMQTFINDFKYIDSPTNDKVLDYMALGIKYYLERMHDSDASVLAKQCPKVLLYGLNPSDHCRSVASLSDNIDSMCKVNCAVIQSAMKEFLKMV